MRSVRLIIAKKAHKNVDIFNCGSIITTKEADLTGAEAPTNWRRKVAVQIQSEPRTDNSPLITGVSGLSGHPPVSVGQVWREKYGSQRAATVSGISIENGIEIQLTHTDDGSNCHISWGLIGSAFVLDEKAL